MNAKQPNQLYLELLSTSGMNFAAGYDSSSRVQMMCSHLGQSLVIAGATERFIQTGMEREYGKYTFSIKMPCDGQIVRVIERYRSKIGQDAIANNPQTIVIYQDVATKEFGIINIVEYCSYHQYFGFQYKPKAALSEIRAGAFIKRDTVLMNTPSITDDGGYKYGAECNIAFMSHPAVSEDSILICKDVLPRFAFKTYEPRTVEFGNHYFPLNLYGDENNYKPFPDIGDVIREDGLLMCLREYNDKLSIVEQNVHSLMEVDLIFDKATYVAGAGGRVIDIKVHHDGQNGHLTTPVGMETQAQKYDNGRREFYNDILREYNRLRRERGESLEITHEFHNLVVQAISVVGELDSKKHAQKLFKMTPIDDWRIEFVIQYDIVPTIGFKLTGLHGFIQ